MFRVRCTLDSFQDIFGKQTPYYRLLDFHFHGINGTLKAKYESFASLGKIRTVFVEHSVTNGLHCVMCERCTFFSDPVARFRHPRIEPENRFGLFLIDRGLVRKIEIIAFARIIVDLSERNQFIGISKGRVE